MPSTVVRVAWAETRKRFELTLDDGKVIEVGVVTSQGKKREDGFWQHEVKFGDGTVQKHVVSTQTLMLPDCPSLQEVG
jgi:squalene cyclase